MMVFFEVCFFFLSCPACMKMDEFFRLKMEMETRQDKNDEKQKKMKKTRRRHIKNMLTIFFVDLGDFYQ